MWRLLGVRIGRRVFDDGCSMPEKTLVTIGDDAILNAGSVIQCHSLEDGAFKSGHTTVGDGITLGVEAFVHYGVTIGDGAVLDAHAFLMKGEAMPPQENWQGNSARPANATPEEIDETYIAGLSYRIAELEKHLKELTYAAARPRRVGAVALLAGAVAAVLPASAVIGITRPGLTGAAVASLTPVHGAPVIQPSRAPSSTLMSEPALGSESTTDSDPTAGSPSTAESDPASEASPAAAGPPNAAEVIRDLYGHLPGDAAGAYAMLAPDLQRRSGGLAGYSRFYQDLASVVVVGDPVPVNTDTTIASIRFQRRGGKVTIARYEFFLSVSPDGKKRLLDGFTQLLDGPSR
jgi:carbonic anhydrase/acetyltransferase-like protein (isoleucine patch superfamily)